MEAVVVVEALKWTMGMDDDGVVHGLLHSLPSWVLKQQVLDYRARACAPTPAPLSRKIKVNAKSLSDRDAVAQAFEEYCRSCGADSRQRLARGQIKKLWTCDWSGAAKGGGSPRKVSDGGIVHGLELVRLLPYHVYGERELFMQAHCRSRGSGVLVRVNSSCAILFGKGYSNGSFRCAIPLTGASTTPRSGVPDDTRRSGDSQ